MVPEGTQRSDQAAASIGTLTRTELVNTVVRILGVTQSEAKEIVDVIFDAIVRSLHRNEKVELRGFGSFRLRQRNARRGRNPKTGASVAVPAQDGGVLQTRQRTARRRAISWAPPEGIK